MDAAALAAVAAAPTEEVKAERKVGHYVTVWLPHKEELPVPCIRTTLCFLWTAFCCCARSEYNCRGFCPPRKPFCGGRGNDLSEQRSSIVVYAVRWTVGVATQPVSAKAKACG